MMDQTESAQVSQKAHASFFQVMKAVLWSMLGVRQQKGYENDTAKITLKQAVIAGLIGGFIFVVSMLTFVYFIIGQMSK
jgi:nitrate reductase NapE component